MSPGSTAPRRRGAASAVAGVAALLAGGAAGAQLPPATAGLAAMAVASDPVFGGVAAVGSVPVTGLIRARGIAAFGAARGATGRGELVLELVLDPRGRGWTPFAGGGAAVVVREGRPDGYMVLTLGLERRPAARRSWWVETGVGGGLRLGAGLRWAWSAPRVSARRP